MGYRPVAAPRSDRAAVRVEQYVRLQRDGFLVVPGLVAPEDVERMRRYADDVAGGRLPVPVLDTPPAGATLDDPALRPTRFHMVHRVHAMAEWALFHPRVLDVVEALAGPDVLALQSMLLLNPPRRGGQGWHQDSHYITTYPDTLLGAWVALDRADEQNGCLWVAPGSHHEPVYPPVETPPLPLGLMHARGSFADLGAAWNASSLDDSLNSLTPVAARYGPWRPCAMQPGDVLFLHSHVLHRAYPNHTDDRPLRAFVSHYCNARSWVPWNHGEPYDGDSANHLHILARGATHLPHAAPNFGTPVDLAPPDRAIVAARLAPLPSGEIGSATAA